MKLKVQLYALLAKYLPPNAENKTATLEFSEGITVGELLKELKIPESMPKIILVNGRHAELERALAEGDTLSIFPPIAGGLTIIAEPPRLKMFPANLKDEW